MRARPLHGVSARQLQRSAVIWKIGSRWTWLAGDWRATTPHLVDVRDARQQLFVREFGGPQLVGGHFRDHLAVQVRKRDAEVGQHVLYLPIET